MTDYQHIEKQGQHQEEDFIDRFDLEKFWFIVRKSLLLCLVFFTTTTSIAYLYVRYTKPLYESESTLKLDFQSEAKTLGLAHMETVDLSEISGEIEILKSKLFFSRVIEAINMDVSYYYYGHYLVDERYRNNPFAVSYLIKNNSFYDKPIDLEILDQNTFRLEYEWGGQEFSTTYRFGDDIETDHFNFRIDKTENFKYPEAVGGYFFLINSKEHLLRYLQSKVEVRPENFNAKTIRISLADYNKFKARDLVMAIDTIYLSYSKETKNKTIEQKIEFLNSQIAETEKKLESFEDYFENFTIENRTINLQSDLALTIKQLDYLDSSRIYLRERISEARLFQKQLESDEYRMITPGVTARVPPAIQERAALYDQLVSKRALKLSAYNENTYVIQQLDQQIQGLKKDLLQVVTNYLEELEEERKTVLSKRKTLESTFIELPSRGTQYNKNRRFYALQEEFLLSLRQSKMELEITRAGTVTNFIILSSASLPAIPVKPQPMLIYGVGIALGIFSSVMFVLIRYLLHNKISSLKELERLTSIPVIGSVPRYVKEKLPLTKLVIKPSSKSIMSESLRTVRTNMDFMHRKNGTRLITITSTTSGEGKTFVTVNLAAVIAFSNQKVCIVDLDMRRPKVHVAFGHEDSPCGMSTLLIGKHKVEECIRHSDIENLDYIPAGPVPPNPSELILNAEYDKILAKLSKNYDIVILDTPPVGLVTDAVLSMQKSDIQLYIVKADYSKRSYIKSIENLKKVNQFSGLSVIINSINVTSAGYGYGKGKGYGYYDESI